MSRQPLVGETSIVFSSLCSVFAEQSEPFYAWHMTEQKDAFVEEMGLYFEGAGLTRMAGRVIGWLLVCDPPYLQQSDLVEALQASKSSVSTALKELSKLALVERFTLPGDRRTYYRTPKDLWTRSMRARMHQITALKELSMRGLVSLDDATPEIRERLEIMRDMNAFMESEFPKLLDAWDAFRNEKYPQGVSGVRPTLGKG